MSHPHSAQKWHVEEYSGPLAGLRATFLAHVAGITRDSAGMVAGLAIGDKSQISPAALEQMKMVSLTHLTAVSGANCAIVIGLVYFLLKRLPISRFLRVALAMVALLFYVLLVGPQPSVLRAATMSVIVLAGVALGRRGAALQALGFAVVILLISNPWLAIDFGFQLSVLATAGILLVAPTLFALWKARLGKWLAMALSVSVAAQAFCLPVLLELQPGLATYSIPANLIAEPLVGPITILGMTSCLVAPVVPALATALTWVASLGAWFILATANWFADAPSSTLNWPIGISGVALAIGFVSTFLIWVKIGNLRIRRGSGIALILLFTITAGHLIGRGISGWPNQGWVVASCDVGQGDATLIRSHGRVALIDVGREPRPIRECLKRLQIARIDLLVLTHFDLDHVGGLDGVLAGHSIDSAIITSYRDARPAAQIAWRKLEKATMVTEGYRGLAGKLGDLDWQILSPHLGAPEALDSNDGSVTMLFTNNQLVFVALADLGERGQRRLIAEPSGWLGMGFGLRAVIVKVAHHGSADQFKGFYEALRPDVALFSVGQHNDYGHPTAKTLNLLQKVGAHSFRTDRQGGIAVIETSAGLKVITERDG